MSNKKVVEETPKVVEETPKVVEEAQGKSVGELKEVATTLQTQLQHHQTMAVKAQGALEVILQMIPQEENNGEGS